MTDLEKVLAFIDEDEGPELNISTGEPGGSSKHGVSMEKLREWRKKRGMSPPTMTDMSNINSALAATIYSEMFAAPIRFDDLPSGINYRVLDISISAGYPTGVLSVLGTALGMPARFDDVTIAEIKSRDPKILIPALGEAWLAYKVMQAKGRTKNVKGWNNRKVRANARALAMAEASTTETTMSWRLAGGITTLLAQVNAAFPHRRKDSDGGIGDARHQAERTSDHNPYIKVNGIGVVRAYDFTHAPETGFDAYAFAAMLLKNKDTRIRYVISNGKIASGKGGPSPWVWRPYHGPNKHDHHTHVSLTELPAEFDSPKSWDLSSMAEIAVAHADAANNYVTPPATLRVGSRGDLVKEMQRAIGLTGKNVDGFFGATVTFPALKAFQTKHELKPIDGICGPGTWKVIRAK